MGGTTESPDNVFLTPDRLAEACCRVLHEEIGNIEHVIEPSAGDGAFVRAAKKQWPCDVRAVEPRAECREKLYAAGATVVDTMRWEDADPHMLGMSNDVPMLVLGNPPYNLKRGQPIVTAEQHLYLAYSRLAATRGNHSRYIAMLLRQSFLATPDRHERLFGNSPVSMGGLRNVWTVVGRPSFTGDGKSDGAEYNLCLWKIGYRGPYVGGWMAWK